MTSRLLSRLRAEMASEGDPKRAPQMQAYMKSTMPFHGVAMPRVRAISRRLFDAETLRTCEEWRTAVLGLWRGAKYREERYAALVLASDRRHAACLTPDALPMIEEMVLTGAWWDLVDDVARLAGEMLLRHPRQMRPVLRRWSTDENLWKRRVSIICQVWIKKDTDLRLLYANIEPNLDHRDFFIRKAIGWALRAYAWTDPAEVARYVRENEHRLSGLSRREALKNVPADMR